LALLKTFVQNLRKLRYEDYAITLIILESFAGQFPSELLEKIREQRRQESEALGAEEEESDCSIIYEEITVKTQEKKKEEGKEESR